MSLSDCCVKGFEWDGEPTGREIDFPVKSNHAYVTGSNPDVAVLFVNDAFGWKFNNNRLLADTLAREVDATVYLPDFFEGGSLPAEFLANPTKWVSEKGTSVISDFGKLNNRTIREPEVLASAQHLRSQYKRLGAVGYCFGGWANLRLGALEFNPPEGPKLMDCVSIGHPTWVTKQDIDQVAVPLQVLAPEHDTAYSPELKAYTFEVLVKGNVPFEYRHFPGVEHSCFTRGDKDVTGDREAMVKGKNAAVAFLREWLHPVTQWGSSEV